MNRSKLSLQGQYRASVVEIYFCHITTSLRIRHMFYAGMLVLVLVFKDSFRTFFKSLSLSWSWGVRFLSFSLSLWVRSLSLFWSLWSSPCPCFSPCKDLFPLLHYFYSFAYYCSVNAYN